MMHPTELCIVARPMSRPSDGARKKIVDFVKAHPELDRELEVLFLKP